MAMKGRKRPPLRYFGGKWLLAPWIISYFPEHEIYAEPYGGGASVLMRKPRANHMEFYNDLDGEIVSFFRVLQNKDQAKELERLLRVTPFARAEFELAYKETEDPVEKARRMIIRSMMGFGPAGTVGRKTGFRSKSLRAHSPPARVWQLYPDSIGIMTERLQGVVIDNRPALDMIPHLDSPVTLFYVDPPYVASTRYEGEVYRKEMINSQHEELLTTLVGLQGGVILSAYNHDIYDDILKGWKKIQKNWFANGRAGKSKRVEVLWASPQVERMNADPN